MTNSSSEEDDESLQIPLATLYSLIFVVGLGGNLLALRVFLRIYSRRNSVHVLLANAVCADLLLTFCLPFRVAYHGRGGRWGLSPGLCSVVGTLFYMNMYVSIALLGLIGVNRWLKVNGAAGRIRREFEKRSAELCALVWAGNFGLLLPYMISEKGSDAQRCFHFKDLRNVEWKAYINICGLVFFWCAFAALVVSYAKIAGKLRRRSLENPDSPSARCFSRNARKTLLVLLVFVVCFVPYHTVRMLYIAVQTAEGLRGWRRAAHRANEVALTFSALNSCLDPFMYYLLSSSVRTEARRLLSRALCLTSAGDTRGSAEDGDMSRTVAKKPQNRDLTTGLREEERLSHR